VVQLWEHIAEAEKFPVFLMKIVHQIICMFATLKVSQLKIEESVIIALREQLTVRIIVHLEKSFH
jgi:hypothetical protein